MTAREALERYQYGLATSAAAIPRLVSIVTGSVLERWPDYWSSHHSYGHRNNGQPDPPEQQHSYACRND